MDTASKTMNYKLDSDSTPMVDKNTMLWGMFLVGVVIGFVAVYIVVAQPMFAQLAEVQRQLVGVQADLQELVGVRDQAYESGNLLSDLTALKGQISDARASLREVRQLRQDVLETAQNTAAAVAALTDLGRLQDALLDQRELTGPASQTVEQLSRIQQRLVQEHASTPRSQETLTDIIQLRRDLAELLNLKQQLAAGLDGLEVAKSAIGELLSLRDQIVTNGANTEAARTQANRLFVLKDELTAHADDTNAAFLSLDRLLEIKDKLLEQTPAVADAVQNLEIISDFQEELAGQIQSLSRMREGLLQIVMLETTVGRVARLLEPLVQIANVRRLSDRELREAARSILENRSTRISSKPDVPRILDKGAAADPFNLPREDERIVDDAEPAGQVPMPLPLPVTESPAS